MSRIEELIERLCPDGVEYKKLGEIGEFIRGNGLQKKDFVEEGFPCIHYGQIYTYYGSFVYETKSFVSHELANKLRKAQPGDLIITTTSENVEDVCKTVAWLGKSDVAIGGHSCLFRHNENPKYLTYMTQTNDFMSQKKSAAIGTKVIDVSCKKLKNFSIPVPPLEVQQEIVRILDNYSATVAKLQADLNEELELRKKQYEYYRDKLLSFNDIGGGTQDVIWKKLSEICDIKRGIRVVKRQLSDDDLYPVYQNSIVPLGYYSRHNTDAETTFIICAGAAGKIGYSKVKFWAADDCFCIKPKDQLIDKYVYYYLMNNHLYFESRVRKAGIPRLSRSSIEPFLIPIPPLPEQQRIVSILDKYEASVTQLSAQLKAEIAALNQQYEYYRDQLLTFKQK